MRTTVMLVHGAWHRPEIWRDVERELRAAGFDTCAPALPSSASHAVAGMYDDAAALRRELGAIGGSVVLVGHSYGGVPVTEAVSGAPNVTQLVYLCAFMLDRGESVRSFDGGPQPQIVEGFVPMVHDPRTAFYSDLPDDRAQEAVGRLTCQTLRSFVEPVTSAGWRHVPSTYIVCEQDKTLPPAAQSAMAERASHVRALPSGHSPFLSMPRRLAAEITQIARF